MISNAMSCHCRPCRLSLSAVSGERKSESWTCFLLSLCNHVVSDGEVTSEMRCFFVCIFSKLSKSLEISFNFTYETRILSTCCSFKQSRLNLLLFPMNFYLFAEIHRERGTKSRNGRTDVSCGESNCEERKRERHDLSSQLLSHQTALPL